MQEKFKSAAQSLGGLLIMIAVVVILSALIGLLIGGAGWLSNRLLPFFIVVSTIAFVILILVLIPLSALRRTRAFAAATIVTFSFLFGVTAWMDGLLTTLSLWGAWAVIVGLFFAGVGVVPVGMLAALFHGQWSALVELSALTLATFGSRFYAIWIEEKHRETTLN